MSTLLDPKITLAVSVAERRGIYALLLGSGLSSAASIPTGWDIMLDLIRELSRAEGPETDDPLGWFTAKFGHEPTYSEVVEACGTARGDRSVQLQRYIVPTDKERTEGKKLPTKAHHAIARLVARGNIKVIVTTNFDRLLESALAPLGVHTLTIKSGDDAGGAFPLVHNPCTLIKVHGDYLDLDARNAASELAAYDPRVITLLDRVFEDYGLIVCGWSGEWDDALRDSITRSTRHRFGTFWMTKGPLKKKAEELVAFRRAVEVKIKSADEAFEELDQRVVALEEGRLAHPQSSKLAAASAKRFLISGANIALEDLISEEVKPVVAAAKALPVGAPVPDAVTALARLDRIEAFTAPLSAVFMMVGSWGNSDQAELMSRILQRVASYELPANSYKPWSAMRLLPATFLLYSAGLAALHNRKFATLKHLLETTAKIDGGVNPLAMAASPFFSIEFNTAQSILGKALKSPGNELLFQRLAPTVGEFIGEDQYEAVFGRFEILLSMVAADKTEYRRMPSWRFDRDSYLGEGGQRMAVRQELASDPKSWPPLLVGMFGGSEERAKAALAMVDKRAGDVGI